MTRGRTWRGGLAAGLATFLVLAGSLVAHAYWTTANVALPSTANAATLGSSLTGASSLALEYKYTGSPSPTRIGMLTYTNTGTAPLAVALTVTGNTGTFAGQVTLALWTTATTCPASVPGGTPTGTLATPPATPASFASVAGGASVRLCVATSVAAALATTQGSSITPTFTLTGTVGTTWSTHADASFTQTVYRVAPPSPITCANSGASNVTLTWTGVAGATTYDVFRADGTTRIGSALTTTTVTLTPTNLGYTVLGPTLIDSVQIRSADSVYTSTSTATVVPISVQSIVGLLLPILRCP